MGQIETALDNYKAQYGVYPPSNPSLSPLYNTLYYELSGVTNNAAARTYTTLDNACTITEAAYGNAFTVGASSIGGIINCTKGSAEDGVVAKNFLPSLRANRYGTSMTPSGIMITNLDHLRARAGYRLTSRSACRMSIRSAMFIPAPTTSTPTICGCSLSSTARPTSSATGTNRFKSTTSTAMFMFTNDANRPDCWKCSLTVEWHDCSWCPVIHLRQGIARRKARP